MEIFHVLNRGVDKRVIFQDNSDYLRFTYGLYLFNDCKILNTASRSFKEHMSDIARRTKEDERELLVDIHAFCLMPNHYHLLLSPKIENGISKFMKKLDMGYAKYFNIKNERVGSLFQGRYKSIQVDNELHLFHLPYYIHMNPLDLFDSEWRTNRIKNPDKAIKFLEDYKWSSFLDYIGKSNFPFVTNRNMLLEVFNYEGGHRKHIAQWLKEMNIEHINSIILE